MSHEISSNVHFACSLLNPKEIVIQGLSEGKSQDVLSVQPIPGKERGVVAKSKIGKNQYICEYKTHVPPYPRSQREAAEAEYAANDEGCYLMDVQTDAGWVIFYGTRRPNQYGRYINHGIQANCKPMAFIVRGRRRVGFITTRDVSQGEELVWNYDAPPEGNDWLRRRPAKHHGEVRVKRYWFYNLYF